jgi:hypothetical protein
VLTITFNGIIIKVRVTLNGIKGGEQMARLIKAIYSASDDQQFGTVEDEVIVLSPDVVVEKYDETDAVFYITEEPVADNQEVLHIDRATCPRFEINFDKPVDEVNYEQLAQFSFLDFIRKFAK